MMHLISIIVPVYNTEKYLRRCLNSILVQTYTNWEAVLVDDGSTDMSGVICDDYAKRDSRFVVIHKSNGGQASARNVALDICKGDYIMFVDSDDYVELDFCKTALNTIMQKNVSCVSFGMYEIRGNQRRKYVTSCPRIVDAEEAIGIIINYNDAIYNFVWNKIFHRKLFDILRFPTGRIYEDNDVMYKLFDKAPKIYVSNDALYNYVRRDDSTTGNPISFCALSDKFGIWYERLQFLYTYYPNLISASHKQLLGLVQSGFLVLPWSSSRDLRKRFINYLMIYRKDIIHYKLNGTLISLFYYCRPLFYIRLFLRRVFRI